MQTMAPSLSWSYILQGPGEKELGLVLRGPQVLVLLTHGDHPSDLEEAGLSGGGVGVRIT